MNDTITIMGFIGNDPSDSTTATGVPVVNFRVGSTRRRYDATSRSWVDSGTNWYTVSAYRQLAVQARASLRKGHPVIVTGRLKIQEWNNGTAKGTSIDIDADAIGHDLRWGTSAFVRANRPQTQSAPAPAESPASDGFPSDEDLGVEGEHGEVREGAEPALVGGGGPWDLRDADDAD